LPLGESTADGSAHGQYRHVLLAAGPSGSRTQEFARRWATGALRA